MVALPSSIGSDGSKVRSPLLKTYPTFRTLIPTGETVYAPGSSSWALTGVDKKMPISAMSASAPRLRNELHLLHFAYDGVHQIFDEVLQILRISGLADSRPYELVAREVIHQRFDRDRGGFS